MKNIFKIVLLGLLGFSLLVYLTAPNAPVKINKTKVLSLEFLPNKIYLLEEKRIDKNSLFKNDVRNLIIVGSHDSLSILTKFDQFYKSNLNITLVANISKAPWFIKKWVIPSKLEELAKNTNIKIVYDENGSFVQALMISKTKKTEFLVYEIQKDKKIKFLFKDNVLEDAINGSMNEQESKKVLKQIYDLEK